VDTGGLAIQGIWLISAPIVQKWAEGLGGRLRLRSVIIFLVLVAQGLRILPHFARIFRCNLLILFVFSSGFGTLNQ